MAFRTIFFILAMLISLLFGCAKDDSPDSSLVGEWTANDTHKITINGDQTTHTSDVVNRDFRPRIVFNANGTGTKYLFDEANASIQETFTYSVNGDHMTLVEGTTSSNVMYSIQTYNSIVRLIITTNVEEPNGVKIETREHYIRK
ncbi:hypothetical protein M8998_09415 [Sphingobacterium sp. lm-10]|uniref:hypothetical protein n=1 Tax=Sphingobacterium sp. lm-10 TaxID=2944904 RepID=UPI00202287A8|nr:hypothetical protein [Sphingobacterium sp. lm-10]MCL7988153.1 hypothetical protein [Sphingobacterium sp. lm-10]